MHIYLYIYVGVVVKQNVFINVEIQILSHSRATGGIENMKVVES